MKTLHLIWVLALVLLAGCSTPQAMKSPPPQPVNGGNSTAGEYRIQPGDQLDIKLFYNPELNEQLTVRSDGRITLQLVNDVVAAGLTPAELTAQLNKAYSAELENPKVAVIVRTSAGDKVYVDGEVNRAGLVTMPGPMTVLQAISQAGGIKETAKTDQVLVLRKGGDGKMGAIRVNLEDLQGRDSAAEIYLKPNDIVYVPKSAIANVNTWIDMYIRKNIPLPIGLGYSL